jgi:hypothetical protein
VLHIFRVIIVVFEGVEVFFVAFFEVTAHLSGISLTAAPTSQLVDTTSLELVYIIVLCVQ